MIIHKITWKYEEVWLLNIISLQNAIKRYFSLQMCNTIFVIYFHIIIKLSCTQIGGTWLVIDKLYPFFIMGNINFCYIFPCSYQIIKKSLRKKLKFVIIYFWISTQKMRKYKYIYIYNNNRSDKKLLECPHNN